MPHRIPFRSLPRSGYRGLIAGERGEGVTRSWFVDVKSPRCKPEWLNIVGRIFTVCEKVCTKGFCRLLLGLNIGAVGTTTTKSLVPSI